MSVSTTLLIFGASGDLTKRSLMPGIGALLEREPDRSVRILGADRVELSQDDFATLVRDALKTSGASTEVVEKQMAETAYFTCDVSNVEELRAVLSHTDPTHRVVLYFALPPAVTAASCEALTHVELPPNAHLAMEKPFGFDLKSARALNGVVAQLVPEDHVHRIDHFLGMTTVIDVMALRFANRMMQAVWSAHDIQSIEICYDENLALENRAGYYDNAGALVDMIQSHLLQVMAIVAMEPPASVTGTDLRDAKAAVLRATRIWDDDVVANTRRGRYVAGRVGRRDVPSYIDEAGVDPNRDTETLAQIVVEVENQRWKGVPITLRSGKALGKIRKEVVITFRNVRHLSTGFDGSCGPDRLIIGLSPDVMELQITTNGTEDAFVLEQNTFKPDLRKAELSEHGEELTAPRDGESMLSLRGGAAEVCRRITGQVLDVWRQGGVPLEEYSAGSPVPKSWPPALTGPPTALYE